MYGKYASHSQKTAIANHNDGTRMVVFVLLCHKVMTTTFSGFPIIIMRKETKSCLWLI